MASLSGIAHVTVAENASAFHLAALREDGRLQVITHGWGPLGELAPIIAETISQPVDLAVLPTGGIGLQADGTLSFWGATTVPEAAFQESTDVVKLFLRNRLLLTLSSTTRLSSFGDLADVIPPDLKQAKDILLSVQDPFGALILRPDGSLRCLGSFSGWQNQVEPLQQRIRKLVDGDNAFAIQLDDKSWRFFGDDLDVETAQAQAEGCDAILIAESTIVGLRTS